LIDFSFPLSDEEESGRENVSKKERKNGAHHGKEKGIGEIELSDSQDDQR
jgi:hypothetical protein